MSWWLRILLLTAAVAVVPRERPCESDQYELHGLCCDFCPAGSYVSRHCDVDRVTECSPCEPGSFTAHRNRETRCLPCAECRDDQEMVSDCTQNSDRRCQCKTGSFYCDSEDCVETCYRCSSSPPYGTGSLRKACPLWCDGPILETCNATRNTICAKRNPESGDLPRSSNIWAVAVPVSIILVTIAVAVTVVCCRRPGVQLPHVLVHWLKHESRDAGDPSQGGTLPTDSEHGQPATGGDNTPLLEPQGPARVPSKDPEGGAELQEVVLTGGGASPEQALQTPVPSAPGGPDQAGAAAPLHALEQQYKQKYVLKDRSPEATNRIYFEFGQEVPKSHWRMFMRLAGLEENDIVICEHENPGNLPEQHHRMLLRWQSKLGRAATPFRLMAALCKMQLRECLENIINKLAAEDILGSKDAEPPN